MMKLLTSALRAFAIGSTAALLAVTAVGGPVVVTPGSNSGYLYFPPAASGGGQSAPAAQGVGGVSYYNNQGSINVTVTAAQAPGTSCGPGCNTANFSTGAGFVKLVATRPTRWTDNGSNVYTNCEAALECQIWVNTNTSIIVRGYPVCFEPDIATLHSKTCSAQRYNNANAVYSTNLTRVGYFIGVINGTPRVAVGNMGMAQFGCYGYEINTNSHTDGKANTSKIMAAACNTPDTAASKCANIAPAGAWYLPVTEELSKIYSAEIPGMSGTFWASTEAGPHQAYTYVIQDGYNIGTRSYTGYYVTCFRQYV